jgi:hypothetical protein
LEEDLLDINQPGAVSGGPAARRVVYASKIFKGGPGSRGGSEGTDLSELEGIRPSIKEMTSRDLWSISRLDALYIQAIEHGIIADSLDMPRLWIASALVSRLDRVRPVLSFSVIVGNRSWYLIPPEILQWAEKVLKYHRSKENMLFGGKLD